MHFSLSVLATGSSLALFISACFNTFFYPCFWKTIRTFLCHIEFSFQPGSMCSLDFAFLQRFSHFSLWVFPFFFFLSLHSTPHLLTTLPCTPPPLPFSFFFFSVLIFKHHSEVKRLALGKSKQSLHIQSCFLEHYSGDDTFSGISAQMDCVHNIRLVGINPFCYPVLISTLLPECVFFALPAL